MIKEIYFVLAILVSTLFVSCSNNDGYQMRGVVLSVHDLETVDWPKLAAESGINTIGTHVFPNQVRDYNCCVHSEKALDIITNNAVEIANILIPTNHRYYFWCDDNAAGCEYSLANRDAVCTGHQKMTNGKNLDYLADNLKVFDAADAVVLEYWLDVSLQNRYKKPAKEVIWYKDVFAEDIEVYTSYGIRNITTFAVYMDDVYFNTYKDTSPLKEYAEILSR